MKERTSGEVINQVLKNFVLARKLPIHKLSLIITNGAPAVISNNKEIINL